MLLEGLPARRVTALSESPDYAERDGRDYSFHRPDAICFAMTFDGDVHSLRGKDAPDGYETITHSVLARWNFEDGVKVGKVYEWRGRAWVAHDAVLMLSFWQDAPADVIEEIANSLWKDYGCGGRMTAVYQTPRHSDDEWIPLGDEDTSPELSNEEKKLRALEYQLHTATPDQKAFIRKGIAIARQKIEQERKSDDKLLAALGEA